jgi:copper chaperone
MVDEDVYCIDILTQVSAVKSDLQSVSVGLVEDHLGHCVQDAVSDAATGDDAGRAGPRRRSPRPAPPSPACSRAEPTHPVSRRSMSATYTVTGMTCGHCAQAVTTEVREIAGVTDVSVDVEAGRVTVEGEGFTDEQVAAAVDQAGYALV